MWPDRVSNPGPLTYESGALPSAIRGPAACLSRLLLAYNYRVLLCQRVTTDCPADLVINLIIIH